jgi:hypothetical protein
MAVVVTVRYPIDRRGGDRFTAGDYAGGMADAPQRAAHRLVFPLKIN